jgi:single-stranded-DNA-specific exonuclease
MIDSVDADRITRELGLPPVISRILAARGILTPSDAAAFLNPKLDDLSDPFQLPDIDVAVNRVCEAIRTGEQICLYGDYDADGVCSVALMVNFLTQLGVNPLAHVPERKEGYGLNVESLKDLKAQGAQLLICLDCGSTNNSEIKWAREEGLDVIVIDHHEVADPLPPALALINPKRRDSRFPTKELAACGVTFFFLLALRRTMSGQGLLPNPINLKRELDLAALGTMADMVPLKGDNRVIARFGMEMMRTQPRTWLTSFFKKRLIPPGKIDEYAMSFIIVPRINAAGRVSHPGDALEFLLCREADTSLDALSLLHEANRRRQRIEEKTLEETVGMLRCDGLMKRNSIVLFKEDWHAGVIGIVAQKLTETFGKPTIIITRAEDIWKGSGRGGEGIDLYDTVSSLSPMLLRFGGHKYACGVSLATENLLPFRDAFDEAVKNMPAVKRAPRFDTEAAFDELTGETIDSMEMLSPFGVGNPRPLLLLRPERVLPLGRNRVKVTDGAGRTWVGWAPKKGVLPDDGVVDIVASASIREERGERFIQLNIRDYVIGKL